ncbi:MAG: tetratricopeptide repeat protein [Rhodopirellula sp.]|nr:tetratricopeptide repeat protein [Rhodopirellula sp.]
MTTAQPPAPQQPMLDVPLPSHAALSRQALPPNAVVLPPSGGEPSLASQAGPHSAVGKDRLIRVFISSTFRDMQEERDELIKRVFPRLRRLCEERGVTFTEVDLRWGVTEEEAAEGKVLPICLAEIERCRPFFISMLGERYGWIPQEIPAELMGLQPWLAEHREKSVTELEILHGVLKKPDMANRAMFYFRDPAYLDRIPAEHRHEFCEQDSKRIARLAALKDRIRQAGLVCRENYPDPTMLGQWVQEDLTVAINQEFPPGEVPDPLDRDAAEHNAFARSRSGAYIGRPEYFEALDRHAASDGPPLVVLGESGSGKSALLANWAAQYRAAHPDTLVLPHFIGATPYSADGSAMLRRILGELKRRFQIAEEIPEKPEALRAAFANWLHMAAARGRVVLVLDALNQLEDRDGAADLLWLPPVIPANVRMVLSTLPGRAWTDLQQRAWPTLCVKPLEPDERRRLIVEYLAQFTKKLSPGRIERIACAPQAANPLYLRALLDELRVFGKYEQLDQRMEHYLAAETVPDLYSRILERWEADYERDRPGLVRDAMTTLWAARRGLAELELLDVLGTGGQALARAVWSPLYLAAEQSLVVRSGLISFFHDYFREAVRRHYVSSDQAGQEAHLRLADYFQAHEHGSRRIDEFPWQLAEARAWQKLSDLLTDLSFFRAAWDANQFEVKARWARLEAESAFRMVDGYRALLDSPRQHREENLSRVASLLRDTGHLSEAECLHEYLLDRCRETGDLAILQVSLGNKALILKARGDLDGALVLLKEVEQICRDQRNKDGLQLTLGNEANVLKDRGDLDGAMALNKEKERICRELGNKEGLSYSLCSQALILHTRGDLEEAMALHKEAERLCRELGKKDGLSNSLTGQALILKARGDLDGAMALLKEVERICRELGNKDGLQGSLGNQALILKARGDLDGAMALHKEAERICRELGNKDGLGRTLANEAEILFARGDLDGAMALHKERERICRELGNQDGLQRTLCTQAAILMKRGELDGAMALLKEVERICRDLGDNDGLQASLGNQALILQVRGNLAGAMTLLKKQERICRKLGNIEGLARSLAGQATAFAFCRKLPREALPLAEEAYRLAHGHGYALLAEKQIKPILDDIRARLQ